VRSGALAVVVALAAACAAAGTPTCDEICDREARCTDERNASARRLEPNAQRLRFDSGECAAACKALERDPEGARLVARHVGCVRDAGADCPAVLACD
jgi:hypothetical protein